MNFIKNKNIFVIVGVYFLTYFSILLNDGLFWDGWVIKNATPSQLIQMFEDNGNYWYGYLFASISEMGNITGISRFITFTSYLLVGLIFYHILGKYTRRISGYALIITLYFITFPVNFARITVMNTPYAVCLLLFALSYLLFMRNNKNIFEVTLASLFLFASLFMSSLVFFIPVLIIHKYIVLGYKLEYGAVKRFVLSNKLLFLIPTLFVFMKLVFFEPGGIYQDSGYNEITLVRLLQLPFRFLEGVYASVVYPINLSIDYAVSNILIFIAFLFGLNKMKFLDDDKLCKESLADINVRHLIKYASILLFLGMFAYLLVGKTPSLINWNSRHQILLPLGISILIFSFMVSIVSRVEGVNLKRYIVLLPIAIFITFNINIYFSYIIDWYKQVSLIEHVKGNDVLVDSTTFIMRDNTKSLNALNRKKSFIDYTGLFKQAFDKEDKLADEVNLFDASEYLQYKKDGIYGINQWEESQPQYMVDINYGSFEVDNITVIKTVFNRWFNPSKNSKNIKNIINIDIKKIGNNYGK